MIKWILSLFKRKKYIVVGFHKETGIYYSEPMDLRSAKYCLSRPGFSGCVRMYYKEVD